MKCIIIPCHPPKIDYLRDFLHSVVKHGASDVKIIIIPTNEAETLFFQKELEEFNKLSIEFKSVTTLLKPKGLEYLVSNNSGIINLKKFAALRYAKDQQYEYAMCIDADSVAVKNLDIVMDTAIQNYKTKKYLGSKTKSHEYIEINKLSAAVLDHYVDTSVYFWFQDAPMYEVNDLRDFFAYMDYTWQSEEGFLKKLSWMTFEHIVFVYFLVLHKGAKIIPFNHITDTIPELVNYDTLMRISSYFNYFPVWMTIKTARFGDISKVGLLNHTDRY
jgi:hypothetical protein